jgi:hypothetical protein
VRPDSTRYSDDPQEMPKLNDPNRRERGGNGKVCPVSKPLTAERFFRENLMALSLQAWLTAAVVMRTFRVGRGDLYDLHAIDLMSLRAPKGRLAGNDKRLRVMMTSIRVTPEYSAFVNKNIASYYQMQAKKEVIIDQINAKLQNDIMQTYMQISAGPEHSRGADIPRPLHRPHDGTQQPV